jgi:hypothetical protein
METTGPAAPAAPQATVAQVDRQSLLGRGERDRRVGEEGNENERIGVRDTGRGGMERVEPDDDVMVLLSDFDLCSDRIYN